MALQYKPMPESVFPPAARPHIALLNSQLRDLFALGGTIRESIGARRSDASIARNEEFQVHVSRITPTITEVVSGQSTVVGVPSLTFSTTNAIGSTTTAVSINSTIALFGATNPAALASVASPGSAGWAARGDHIHIFPTALQTTSNLARLTATDDATDITLTGSLGNIALRPTSTILSLPMFTGVGDAGSNTALLRFTARTSAAGAFPITNTVRFGFDASLTIDDVGTTYTSQNHTLFRGSLTNTASQVAGSTFTTETNRVMDLNLAGGVVGAGAGTHSWTERTGALIAMNTPGASGTGNVTVTDQYGLRITHALPVATGTVSYVNARGCQVQMPRTGSTIRRGFELVTDTTASGTAPSDAEGFLCGAITFGTSRSGFKSLGATTGSPTDVYNFYAASHAVGTNRYAFYGVSDTFYHGGKADIIGTIGVTGFATFGNSMTLTGTFDHNGAYIGLYGATPTVQFGTTGTVNGFAAGTSTAVTVDSTFTGNTGSLAYTISDAIRALKLLGALAY